MAIYGLSYFNDSGARGAADTPDDPYFRGGEQSNVARALGAGGDGVEWHYDDHELGRGAVSLRVGGGCRAVLNESKEFVIVKGERQPDIVAPHNAAVFHQNGNLNHVIIPPENIEISIGGKKRVYHPEGYGEIRSEDNEVIIAIYVNYDWFQIRSYNIFTRFWGGVRGVGRL